LWAYSTKHNRGYVTFGNDEEAIYPIIYGQFGYTDFDKVPEHTEEIYKNFIKHYHDRFQEKTIPEEYQGYYQRVKINEKNLETIFLMANDFMMIRNPEIIKYPIIYANNNYRVKGKDNTHGAKIGLYQAKSCNKYFLYDGTLYKKINDF
jgi:hypothetical protein